MSRKGLFVPLLFESQSVTLACNGAVFSDCSERIVRHPSTTFWRNFNSTSNPKFETVATYRMRRDTARAQPILREGDFLPPHAKTGNAFP